MSDLYKHILSFNFNRLINRCHVVYADGRDEPRICFAGAKRKAEGVDAVLYPGAPQIKDINNLPDFTEMLTERCGWTPETFEEYRQMMGNIHPAFGPMVEGATMACPSIKLCSEKGKERFIAWCFWRLIWERPDMAHRVLLLYRAGHDLSDLCVWGTLDVVGSGHWFMGTDKLPYDKAELDRRLLGDDDADDGQSIDEWLKAGGWGQGADFLDAKSECTFLKKAKEAINNTYA